MSEYKKGDRVRVVIEGEVAEFGEPEGPLQWVRDSGGVNIGWLWFKGKRPPGIVSIEKLPDPEPEWHPGDVVIDAIGRVVSRHAGLGKWRSFSGALYQDEVPIRPLTLLVRDGKAVGG